MQAAGLWYSPWLLAGIPGPGTAPSSGVAGNVVDSAVTGGIVFTNPGSGLTYLHRLAAGALPTSGAIYLYDRLWHNSGLSATNLSAQTVNSVTLPSRCPVLTDPTGETFDTLGNGVEAWFQVYVAMGSGATAPSISYTDEAGNSATGTVVGMVSASGVGRCFPFGLAAGDRGVRSIQSYTNGASLTSGTFGLGLRRRIATIPTTMGSSIAQLDFTQLGLPAIPNSAHLELIYVPASTLAPTLVGDLTLVQG